MPAISEYLCDVSAHYRAHPRTYLKFKMTSTPRHELSRRRSPCFTTQLHTPAVSSAEETKGVDARMAAELVPSMHGSTKHALEPADADADTGDATATATSTATATTTAAFVPDEEGCTGQAAAGEGEADSARFVIFDIIRTISNVVLC